MAPEDREAILAANLARVEEAIAAACARAGRPREEVTLVAVTKTHPAEDVVAAYRLGLGRFGENRIEELEAKAPEVARILAGPAPEWHMIGHVQGRKARRAAECAAVVHSVDSLHLAQRLDRACAELGRRLPVLLEVNVSGEEAKFGFSAHDPAARSAFVQEVAALGNLVHLDVRGLMTMAPLGAGEPVLHGVFAGLRELADVLRVQHSFSDWRVLSMGMTDDYPVAIAEGATMIRVGRAIFGAREQ